MWRLRRASSLAARELRQVPCGWYLPGRMGMRSRMGRPNICMAGDSFVSLSGVLRNGPLEVVDIEVPIESSIVGDQPFHGFDPYFRSAAGMGEGH